MKRIRSSEKSKAGREPPFGHHPLGFLIEKFRNDKLNFPCHSRNLLTGIYLIFTPPLGS